MFEDAWAIAGTGLHRMFGAVTDHRLLATGVGMLVTCLVQSSSITTVMVVGFVDSRWTANVPRSEANTVEL